MTQIDKYFGDWIHVLDYDLLVHYREAIVNMYKTGYKFEPLPQNVFRAFRECPFNDCKVVIVGQDPYPQHGVATGLAFANDIVQDAPEIMSPSLKIIRESVFSLAKFGEFPTFDPSLQSWAKQGVLLLNSALTVATDKPDSHAKAWKPFFAKLATQLSLEKPNLCWILFGKRAWELNNYISSGKVLTEYHPAYFARNNIQMGNWMWIAMNNYLKEEHNTTIKLYE